ncbi:MAG: hypothetical protein ACKO38_04505, partial [Planctomycetota bacterium]
ATARTPVAAAMPEKDGLPVDDPAHQAVLLGEHFAEMRRLREIRRFPAEFAEMLEESQLLAERIERELPRWPTSPAPTLRTGLDNRLRDINDRCLRCHERYRDMAQVQAP